MISLKWPSVRIAGAAAVLTLLGGLCVGAQAAQGNDANDAASSNDKLPAGTNLTDLFKQQDASDVKEAPLQAMPALPSNSNLLPFTLDTHSDLNFMVDSKSISVGKDGVVRYTVVIDTPSGARNIRYEGIHCNSYSWRLYSGTNSDGTAWDNASTAWTRIENSPTNGYQASLASNYFCDNKAPVPKASSIVQSIRYGKSLRANMYR